MILIVGSNHIILAMQVYPNATGLRNHNNIIQSVRVLYCLPLFAILRRCSIYFNKIFWPRVAGGILMILTAMAPISVHAGDSIPGDDETYKSYTDFLNKVYQTMDENYYQPVSREAFDQFIEDFKTKIYSQLKDTGKSNDYIRWRSAAYLVEKLKSPEDIFSEFYPPKPAKEYETKALGKRVDLGVEGVLNNRGFQVTHIEPRSDAYTKGIRQEDILLKIDGKVARDLKQEEVRELLNPLFESTVKIVYLDVDRNLETEVDVVSKEYFKQMVFMVPTKSPNIYALEIRGFNRKTAEDLLRFLNYFRQQGPVRGLILDLRGNPGGPPLSARELSSFFLPSGDEFAYFQKKGQPKASLDVPAIPQNLKYDGPLVILVDHKSGSSSELFSGILQRHGRATLMGQRTAGQVMLKSMFDFDDGSMVLLVTARGHHPDGQVFSFNGLLPERLVGEEEKIDLIDYASLFFVYTDQNKK